MMRFGIGNFGFLGGYLLMALVMATVAVLAILGIIALVRYIRTSGQGHNSPPPGVNPALLILDERYARGEISDEEYRAKKAEILH